MNHIATFDPNALTENQPIWATYDGYKFKTFTKRGPALNAFSRGYEAKIFHWDTATSKWVEDAYKGTPRMRCSCCDKFITDDDRSYTYYNAQAPAAWRANWQWERDASGNIASPLKLLFACKLCLPMVSR